MSPEGYTTARNRVLRLTGVIFAGTILFTLVLAYKMFGQTWHRDSIGSLLPAVVAVLIVCGALASGLRKGLKQNQESWDSFELVIGDDFAIRRKKNFPELEIQRHEVTRIRESTTGLYLETKVKDHTIGIPRALNDYEDAKERLSRWMPLVHEQPRGWTAPTRWMWMYPVFMLAICAVFFLSGTKWVIVATGVPLILALSVGIWLIQRSVQFSTQIKRQSLVVVLPLLAIIVKLILAIRNLR